MILDFLQNYPFILAFILGLIPALIWLWFWLKEDIHHEPARMITLSFLGGMAAVLVALPLEKVVYNYFADQAYTSFILWGAIEEITKFALIYFIALRNKCTDEPMDDIIYMIVGALGFVTMENTLFLIPTIHSGDIVDTVVHGNLRFIGASLLHIMSSATIGVCVAMSYYKPTQEKVFLGLFGIFIAIVLHTCFNLFIINGTEANILLIFGMVWLGIIILLSLFERVKHIDKPKLI
ncbi:MAG TPA: PrsW family glutamic-type intramembrane protease [Candidatus Paceibacterota bacterium]